MIIGNVRYLPKLIPETIHVWGNVILGWIKMHDLVYYGSNPNRSSKIIEFPFLHTTPLHSKTTLFIKIPVKDEKPKLIE